MESVLALVLAFVGSGIHVHTPTPVCELGKPPLGPGMATGKIDLACGAAVLNGTNRLSLPAALLGIHDDYPIKFEIRRPAGMKAGCGFVVYSNADEKSWAGIKGKCFPPEYSCGWISKNGHMTVEQRGLLNDAFNKITLVVKDRQLVQFRNIRIYGQAIFPSGFASSTKGSAP